MCRESLIKDCSTCCFGHFRILHSLLYAPVISYFGSYPIFSCRYELTVKAKYGNIHHQAIYHVPYSTYHYFD